MSRKLVDGLMVPDIREAYAEDLSDALVRRVDGDMMKDEDEPEHEFCNELCREVVEGDREGFAIHGGCDTCPLADEPE